MKIRQLTSVLLLSLALASYSQKVAITLDDAPYGAAFGISDEQKIENFKKILAALKQYDVKATFFITTANMTEKTKEILNLAKEAGHQFGNHSNTHPNLNEVSVKEYMADIKRCDELAGEWLNTNYFRYPYLRRGNTQEKKDAVQKRLAEMKMVVAPVTIDNEEWMYNRDYSKALTKGNRNDRTLIADKYLRHMAQESDKYRQMGVDLMGREIAHILLIHVNTINSDYLKYLLAQYAESGWQFISLDEAMEDDFYKMTENYIGNAGISQLDRVRLEKE